MLQLTRTEVPYRNAFKFSHQWKQSWMPTTLVMSAEVTAELLVDYGLEGTETMIDHWFMKQLSEIQADEMEQRGAD